MPWSTALVALAAMSMVVPSTPQAAPPVDPVSDTDYCQEYGEGAVVVLGRPQPPMVVRMSGEAAIERARQELSRVEAEIERLSTPMNAQQRLEHDAEFSMRLVEARNERGRVQAIYPPPQDVTFIPVQVERVLRGEPLQTFLAHMADPHMRLEPDRVYLMRGYRSKDLIPLPEMTDVALSEYVETISVSTGSAARREADFLAATASGGTLLGQLTVGLSVGGGYVMNGSSTGRQSLRGTRVAVSSGSWQAEALTDDEGRFALTGIPSGRLSLLPLLPAETVVIDRASSSLEAREGSCQVVRLQASLNGRVRGRIVNAPAIALDAVALSLDAGISSAGPGLVSMTDHALRSDTRPNPDGTFEFVGVSPGTYVLTATYTRDTGSAPHRLVTYFPGTSDLAEALRIDVGRATQHDGLDFAIATEVTTASGR